MKGGKKLTGAIRSHQQAARPQELGQAQVGEIPRLQVHLHRAAGPLQH